MSDAVFGANVAGVSVRPHHDLAVIQPCPEFHAALHNVQVDGGNIMTKMFGAVKLGNPISYTVTGKLNKFAIGRIVSLGKGTASGQGQDKPAVKVGDIVGFDLGQVGHVLPDGNYTLIWRNLLCLFDPGRLLPMPLMNNVMVQYEDELVDRFRFQKTNLVMPKIGAAPIKTNDRAHTRVGITVARVLDVGAGRFVRKVFEGVDVVAGEVVAFMPHNGVVDFTFTQGRLFKFVPWSEILFSVDGMTKPVSALDTFRIQL